MSKALPTKSALASTPMGTWTPPSPLFRLSLANDLWFDPDPLLRNTDNADPIPTDKVDAYSVFLHELEHAFAFNGNRDGITGVLPASADNVESTFDQYIAADNSGNLFFTGPHAKALYGGNVPLTFADAFHVGNRAPRPGTNIADDLMNGVGFVRGHRYDISALDLAMLTDAGVPIIGSLPTLTVADATHAEGDAGTTSFIFNVSLRRPPATKPGFRRLHHFAGLGIDGRDANPDAGNAHHPRRPDIRRDSRAGGRQYGRSAEQ